MLGIAREVMDACLEWSAKASTSVRDKFDIAKISWLSGYLHSDAKLKAELDELRYFFNKINKNVVAGEIDSNDSALHLLKKYHNALEEISYIKCNCQHPFAETPQEIAKKAIGK